MKVVNIYSMIGLATIKDCEKVGYESVSFQVEFENPHGTLYSIASVLEDSAKFEFAMLSAGLTIEQVQAYRSGVLRGIEDILL